jgi:hypothetical protein
LLKISAQVGFKPAQAGFICGQLMQFAKISAKPAQVGFKPAPVGFICGAAHIIAKNKCKISSGRF